MKSKRFGFTLVELVVVVLILGILAAVAAPKVLNTSDDARLNSTLQSLTIVRDAIELYKAETGSLPGGTTLDTDLEDYIRGQFPLVNVGPNKGGAGARLIKNDTTASGLAAAACSGTQGWIFNSVTGEFSINYTLTSGNSGDTTELWTR